MKAYDIINTEVFVERILQNMNNKALYIKNINIKAVRHLKNIFIDFKGNKGNILILTGKNGSGKTSVLNAMKEYLSVLANDTMYYYDNAEDLDDMDISFEFNMPNKKINISYNDGNLIFAFYSADRAYKAIISKHVEAVKFNNAYGIDEYPGTEFVKYLVDLKMKQALAAAKNNVKRQQEIQAWFDNFEGIMKRIYKDDSLELLFDDDNFTFTIKVNGREPFDFNTMASGYAAIMDIVLDLMGRMHSGMSGTDFFDKSGIVLIDEIDAHLHLELQRDIISILVSIFPNIQFVVSTHSPYVLGNAEGAIIYDLEKQICVYDGLTDIPYDGIVKGYFESEVLSEQLKSKFERYKEITAKKELSDDDFEELAKLEIYLDEIPDYLALGITTEYRRLKLEFENREDI